MLSAWKELAASHPGMIALAEIAALAAGAWVLRKIMLRAVRRWAQRTRTTVDDAVVDLLVPAIKPLLILSVITVSLNLFAIPAHILKIINRGLSLAVLAVLLYYASRLVQLFLERWLDCQVERENLRDPIRFVTRVLFAGLAVMLVLDNLGISLTAIWTTLGVGSVAVALALQDTLSNFFAGVYVRLDRPVRVGDYIKLESGEEGFVLQLGWRSTRMRTLPNNVIVVPNSKLASTIVTNYSLPETEMSLLISVSVSYDSNPDQVETILVEEAANAAGCVQGLLPDPPPFVRFIPGFGDSSLNFTLICRVKTFVDQYLVQHELRKRMLVRFRREGISIPYPQRDIHLTTPIGVSLTEAQLLPVTAKSRASERKLAQAG